VIQQNLKFFSSLIRPSSWASLVRTRAGKFRRFVAFAGGEENSVPGLQRAPHPDRLGAVGFQVCGQSAPSPRRHRTRCSRARRRPARAPIRSACRKAARVAAGAGAGIAPYHAAGSRDLGEQAEAEPANEAVTSVIRSGIAQIGLVGARNRASRYRRECAGTAARYFAAVGEFLEHAGDHWLEVSRRLPGDVAHFEIELVELAGRPVGRLASSRKHGEIWK